MLVYVHERPMLESTAKWSVRCEWYLPLSPPVSFLRERQDDVIRPRIPFCHRPFLNVAEQRQVNLAVFWLHLRCNEVRHGKNGDVSTTHERIIAEIILHDRTLYTRRMKSRRWPLCAGEILFL